MVSLYKMTEEYYDRFYKNYCIEELKKQCIENGYWSKNEANEKALQEQESVLKEGIKTSGNYLFCIYNELSKKIVGEIWLGELEKENMEIGFIFDIHINEDDRNKGYAKKAIIELEKIAKTIGFSKIRLHVFVINEYAIKAYLNSGFNEFNKKDNSIWMEKVI